MRLNSIGVKRLMSFSAEHSKNPNTTYRRFVAQAESLFNGAPFTITLMPHETLNGKPVVIELSTDCFSEPRVMDQDG